MYLIILIILLLIIVLYICNNKEKNENFENTSIDIGNVLSEYYYKYFISVLKKENFNYENNKMFINLFPKKIRFNKQIYDELIKHNIKYENYKNYETDSFWTSESNEKQIIHNIMKPYMNKIMNNTFVKNNLKKIVKYPIIHFRCADAPFIKHKHYYLQKYKYFKSALDSLPDYDKIIILSCTNHKSIEPDKKSCERYIELLIEYLNEYNPIVKCGTNVDDFISMFYAPAVVSTQSSYSFMSGFFGNGKYIQPNFMEDNIECSDCTSEYKGYNIPHNIITDYHDINEVYKLLI